MGCTPLQTSAKYLQILNMTPQEQKLWTSLLKYNFDSDMLKYVMEIQDIHVTTLGEYLAPPKVAVLVLELKKFLFVAGSNMNEVEKPRDRPAPSPIIDRLWRLLISSSKLYHNLYKELFGKELIRSTRSVLSFQGYNETRKKLMFYFGKVHDTVWPDYETEELYKLAHHGFLRLKVPDFFTFHEYFNRITRYPDSQPSIKKELNKLRDAITHRNDDANLMKILEDKKEEVKHSRKSNSISLTDARHVAGRGNRLSPQRGVPHSFVEYHHRSPSVLRHFQQDKPTITQITQIEVGNDTDEALPEADDDFEDRGKEGYKVKEGPKISFLAQPAEVYKPIVPVKKQKLPFNIKIYLRDNWLELKNTLEAKVGSHLIPRTLLQQFADQICVQDAELVFDEYKRYMVLREVTILRCRIIPPHLVQIAHNFHIAECKDYRSFCKHSFGKMMHRVYLPRDIEERHKEEYKITLQLYQRVFNLPPSSKIWPPVEQRLDLDQIYNYKYFDVVGYMTAMLEKNKYRGLERGEQVTARKAIASMEMEQEPKRGEDYINVKSPGKRLE